MSSTATITFPIPLAEITDDGLRRIEAACRGERLRRARAAQHEAGLDHNMSAVDMATDPDDAILETLSADQLAAIARDMDGEIVVAATRAGVPQAAAGGLAG